MLAKRLSHSKHVCCYASSHIKYVAVCLWHFHTCNGCINHIVYIHKVTGLFTIFKDVNTFMTLNAV